MQEGSNSYVRTWVKNSPTVHLNQTINSNPLRRNREQSQDLGQLNHSMYEMHPNSNSARKTPLKERKSFDIEGWSQNGLDHYIYEEWNSKSFKEQVNNMNISEQYKIAFIRTFERLQTELSSLKGVIKDQKHDINEVSQSLSEVNKDHEYLKTFHGTKLKELEDLHTELEELKNAEAQKFEGVKEKEKKLQDVNVKFFNAEIELGKSQKHCAELKSKFNSLFLEKVTLEGKVETLEATNVTYEKTIGTHESHLASKLALQDDKFEKVNKDNAAVLDLLSNTKTLYEDLNTKQQLHINNFSSLSSTVNSLDGKVTRVAYLLDTIMNGPLQSIDANVSSLNKTVKEDLGVEIQKTCQKRNELDASSNEMETAYTTLSGNFQKYYTSIITEMKRYKSMSKQNIEELLPIFLGVAVISVIIGCLLMYFIVGFRRY